MPQRKETLIRSSERVKKFAEVFTPAHIVTQMCDLIPESEFDIDNTFLEPACGNGNFLAEIFRRKLEHCETAEDALRALSSIYGIDIQADNVLESRERLVNALCNKFGYTLLLTPVGVQAADIVSRNIIQADFLKLSKLIETAETWDEIAEYAPKTLEKENKTDV